MMTKGFSKRELWTSLVSQAGLVSTAPAAIAISIPTQCAIPVLMAMEQPSSSFAGGNPRPSTQGPVHSSVQVFEGHEEHACMAHVLCQCADGVASLLKGSETAQLVATASSENIGQFLSLALTHMIDQTFSVEHNRRCSTISRSSMK